MDTDNDKGCVGNRAVDNNSGDLTACDGEYDEVDFIDLCDRCRKAVVEETKQLFRYKKIKLMTRSNASTQ